MTNSPEFLYILLGICFLVMLFLIYLVSKGKFSKKQKNAPPNHRPNPNRDRVRSTEPLNNPSTNSSEAKLRNEISQLKETIKNLRDENSVLKMQKNSQKNQIEVLKKHNVSLQDVNVSLSSQRDKLTKSKDQLEELQRKKEDLFAMAVHDIKNPAGAIKGYVDLLRSYDLNAVEQQEIMSHLVLTSSRIIEIAQSISVIMTEPDPSGGLKLNRSSIKTLIDHVVNRNNNYAEGKGIKIVNSSSPDTPDILIDENKLDEALDNLINNAIKFGYKDTLVQVRSYFNSTYVLVEVSDNGIGISKDDLSMAFNKGQRLSSMPTGGETSSGLGLWIVKTIVEDHGGKISVESKLGAGTKFTIQLPIKV